MKPNRRRTYRRKIERRVAKPGVTTRHTDAPEKDNFVPKRVRRVRPRA